MLSRLSKREQIMAITALILIVLVGYYFYLYKPLQQDISQLQTKVNIKENQIKTTRDLEEKLPELMEKYNQLKSNEQVGVGLTNIDAGDFIKTLYRFVAESGVELQSYLPGREGNLSNLKLIIYGKYQGILEFLTKLKVLENNVQYSNLDLKPASEDRLVMEIKLLYKKGETGGGSP